MASYRLLTYDDRRAGLLVDGKVYEIAAEAAADGAGLPTHSTYAMLQDWDKSRAVFEKIADGPTSKGKALADVKLLTPFPHPGTIFCAGANYFDHAKEMQGKDLDKSKVEPLFFLKAMSSVVGPGDPVQLSADYSQKIDWEVEIGVVIGKAARHVSVDDALDYVAGYTIINDLSARDRGNRDDWPFGMDWFRHKSFHNAAPIGPWMTPASEIPDPQKLALKTIVSDEVKQDSNSDQMVFGCAELISNLSSQIALKPGDMIATGTCAGVGAASGVFLKPGDTITMSVEGLGELENTIVAE